MGGTVFRQPTGPSPLPQGRRPFHLHGRMAVCGVSMARFCIRSAVEGLEAVPTSLQIQECGPKCFRLFLPGDTGEASRTRLAETVQSTVQLKFIVQLASGVFLFPAFAWVVALARNAAP